MSHLGARVSALLDGRLDAAEEERCWQHVSTCHPCRDLVEREGWVKTSLASWAGAGSPAPDALKSSLLDPASTRSPQEPAAVRGPARTRGALVLGGGMAGAVGAAVVGVVALGVAPSAGPAMDRRAPATDITRSTSSSWLEGPSMRAARHAVLLQLGQRGTHPGRSHRVTHPGDRHEQWVAQRGTMGR